jgi:hypothetical protein
MVPNPARLPGARGSCEESPGDASWAQESSRVNSNPRRRHAPPHRRVPKRRAARPSVLASRTSPPERQLELAPRGSSRSGRGLRREAELSEQPRCGLPGGRRFQPPHRSVASRTMFEVRLEHMSEEPRPSLAGRRELALAVRIAAGQVQLIARCGRRAARCRVESRARDHLGAEARVARQHAEIPEQMKPRGRDRGDQAHHQVMRLEEDRSGAVLPDALQRELEPAIGTLLETVLGHRRARDVAAEPLELPSVGVGSAWNSSRPVGLSWMYTPSRAST